MLIYNLIQKCYRAFYKIKTKYWYGIFLSECGKNNSIIKPILLTPKFIFLKSNILIRDNCRIEAVSEYMGAIYNPRIIIDECVTIEQNLHLTCANSITIGRDTAIAANVTITDISHPYADINLSPEKQPLQVSKVLIGAACKIYNNAVILPGTILGNHNIVGANAVVSGVFPDYCVIAGAPARILKQYNTITSRWEKADGIGKFKQVPPNS